MPLEQLAHVDTKLELIDLPVLVRIPFAHQGVDVDWLAASLPLERVRDSNCDAATVDARGLVLGRARQEALCRRLEVFRREHACRPLLEVGSRLDLHVRFGISWDKRVPRRAVYSWRTATREASGKVREWVVARVCASGSQGGETEGEQGRRQGFLQGLRAGRDERYLGGLCGLSCEHLRLVAWGLVLE